MDWLQAAILSVKLKKLEEWTAKRQELAHYYSIQLKDLDQINSGLRIDKGKANKIEFFIEKDLMLMQGNAEFYEGNMRIISDEIHYSLEEDRVLKSVYAKRDYEHPSYHHIKKYSEIYSLEEVAAKLLAIRKKKYRKYWSIFRFYY